MRNMMRERGKMKKEKKRRREEEREMGKDV